ncbi:MAG: capsular biosynthesis protein [Muribaculaceae bacterium]|nr:capsular biosynthesis protein [Muribaculaceae bacterium]
MWLFGKKKSLRQSGMFNGFTDWHSHILPGVDDGIRTMDESLAALRQYEELGVKRIWLTPHIMEDIPNTPDELRKRYDELRSAWNGRIELRLAAEHMLDSIFEERLESGDVMPLGDNGEYLLVETSYYNPPMGLDDMLDKIKSKGFYPVLAHPERYRYMDEDDYRRLKERGVLFQMNYASLVGGYGETSRKKAEWLLKNGMIDFLGSDLHRVENIGRTVDSSPRKNEYIDLITVLPGKI